jgi:hypothetical protein
MTARPTACATTRTEPRVLTEADAKADMCPTPQPVVLTPEEAAEVSGGLNPQPLPPGRAAPYGCE